MIVIYNNLLTENLQSKLILYFFLESIRGQPVLHIISLYIFFSLSYLRCYCKVDIPESLKGCKRHWAIVISGKKEKEKNLRRSFPQIRMAVTRLDNMTVTRLDNITATRTSIFE